MRVVKVTGLPMWIYVTEGLHRTQSVYNGMESTVLVLLLTAHDVWTRGCSHFTTVFGHTAPLNFIAVIVPPGNTSTPRLQVCSGSWARFENGGTYWNAGHRAYCPGPPRGMFLQIWASCTFHGNVLSKAVAVVVVSVANLAVCVPHQHGTIAQSAGTEVLVVCDQEHLHLLFVSLFLSPLIVRIALRCIRCTTFQCTLDSPRITYIILCSPRVHLHLYTCIYI